MFWRLVLRVCAVLRFEADGVFGFEREGMVDGVLWKGPLCEAVRC